MNFFGQDLQYFNPMVGDQGGQSGVFWDLLWTRADGGTLSTQYFDEGGSIGDAAPQGLTFTLLVAAPEPSPLFSSVPPYL